MPVEVACNLPENIEQIYIYLLKKFSNSTISCIFIQLQHKITQMEVPILNFVPDQGYFFIFIKDNLICTKTLIPIVQNPICILTDTK